MEVIIAAIITATATVLVAIVALWRTAKHTQRIAQTIEVNTNKRLSEALNEIKSLRITITQLVEALAIAQESPAAERQPIPVEVIDPATVTPYPPE